MKECCELHVVETNDASCPEGSIRYGGIQDVNRGFRDGAFCSIFHTKGDDKCHGQEDDPDEMVLAIMSRRGIWTVMSSRGKAGSVQKQGVHCWC